MTTLLSLSKQASPILPCRPHYMNQPPLTTSKTGLGTTSLVVPEKYSPNEVPTRLLGTHHTQGNLGVGYSKDGQQWPSIMLKSNKVEANNFC